MVEIVVLSTVCFYLPLSALGKRFQPDDSINSTKAINQ